MTKYQEFLESAGIISEEDFNKIINNLPEVEILDIDFSDLYQFNSKDEIAKYIIDKVLENWEWAWCEEASFEDNTFNLADAKSLKDLEEIKNAFPNWTISNYAEVYSDLISQDKQEKVDAEKETILNEIRNHASIEELREIRNKLQNVY